ncbi:MAG: hormogonium polysaccharide biosynthesis protein HpsA [Spirulinaceae cyanobacterium]
MFRRLLQSFKQLMQFVAQLPSQLLQLLRRFTRRQGQAAPSAGFVLPTVTMVVLVVILTSATLVFRSIDRAKNASNFRVNQVVMNAAAPAVERAKAKMGALFADTSLPRGTPSDAAVDGVFDNDRYDLDDEVRLQVAFDYGDQNGRVTNTGNGGSDGIQPNERITTAWRFPVDTDNNGRYDSFTLYGVYYRSNTSRARQPVEARTKPQVLNAQNKACEAAAGTSAGLVGSDGWFNQEGVLKKAFYVYVANVPITELNDNVLFPMGTGAMAQPYNDRNRYEVFRGNRGFTAMEYQQDRARIPLGNNAIVYEDDLDLSSGTTLRINGRIVANSNLFASEPQNADVRLYQVSSDESCFYEEENGKILVGGNMSAGRLQDNEAPNSTIQVDLFQGRGENVAGGDNRDEGISDKTRSVRQTSPETAYNNKAYEARIAYLVERVMTDHGTQPNKESYKSSSQDPSSVKTAIEERLDANPELESELERLRAEELELWFRNRTRRVPSREVPFGRIAPAPQTELMGVPYQDYGTDNLRPIDAWILPEQGNVKLDYRRQQLPALNPETRGDVEELLGDRVVVGNNLPALWWDEDKSRFASEDTENYTDYDNSIKWWTVGTANDPNEEPRYRKTQAQRLDVPGATSRNGFWETSAAKIPEKKNESVGGLRVVTGAGIYLPAELRAQDDPMSGRAGGRPQAEYVVWPDTMPQPPNPVLNTGIANAADHPYRQKLVERYAEYNGEMHPVYIDDEAPDNATLRPDLALAGIPSGDILRDFTPKRPYLKMRASVVYHYSHPDNDRAAKEPIACVSSFYDPTDWKTAQNWRNLPDFNGHSISGQLANNTETRPNLLTRVDGFSNNGITYPVRRNSFGVNFGDRQLQYQADLVYPNGRPVNPALKKALEKGNQDDLTLADRAAIDAAYCGLDILASEGNGHNDNPTGGFNLVHGTVQELAFLDGRQVKSVQKPTTSSANAGDAKQYNAYTVQQLRDGQSDFRNGSEPQYDLEVEQRLPMEIRATVIDLKRLRRGNGDNNAGAIRVPNPEGNQDTYPDQEYLFPMSGIIYATRDDALPDASNRPTDPEPLTRQSLTNDPIMDLVNNEPNERTPADKVSATDYWLDPTRRPNGIMLINGRELNREPDNRFVPEQDEPSLTTEKGLTLASNLPVYIKAENAPGGRNSRPGFNVHERPDGQVVEEFTDLLAADWSNFYTRIDDNLDPNFACRRNDPRLQNLGSFTCTQGDKWRVANVLSDAMTLLSERYRFGFRNEGDYDIRNNQSDNLFRDSKVLLTSGANRRLHEAFTPESKGLLPADFPMQEEYKNVVRDGTEILGDAVYTNINALRKNNGFNYASLAVNGISSDNKDSNVFVPSWINRDGNVEQRDRQGQGGVLVNDKKYSIENGDLNKVLNSSYFNNMISPVQRRVDDRYEYLMESCLKLPVSQCDPAQDWVIRDTGPIALPENLASNQVGEPIETPPPNSDLIIDSGSTVKAPKPALQRFPRRVAFLRYHAPDPAAPTPPHTIDITTLANSSKATADYSDGDLIVDSRGFPVPLAIDSSGNIMCNTYANAATSLEFEYLDAPGVPVTCPSFVASKPRKGNNALWYAPAQSDRNNADVIDNRNNYRNNDKPIGILVEDGDNNDNIKAGINPWDPGDTSGYPSYPPLIPVTQLNSAKDTDRVNSFDPSQPYNTTNWLPAVNDYANNIHFNLVMATGDTPPRSSGNDGESNGGLANLPRFLENWTPGGTGETAEIKGSFIQLQRSRYATAPFNPNYPPGYNFDTETNVDSDVRNDNQSLYGYKQRYLTGNGRFNHYRPPGRQWGFDVGILSQLPDLFSQQFGLPATDEPNEFYREASRRDDWVRTLLCAVAYNRQDINDRGRPAINQDQRPVDFCRTNALTPF